MAFSEGKTNAHGDRSSYERSSMTTASSQAHDSSLDDHVAELVVHGKVKSRDLEAYLGDVNRAVLVRRKVLELKLKEECGAEISLEGLPYQGYDFGEAYHRCIEETIGYIPVPVGITGAVKINGGLVRVPMATVEGTLVASTSRGFKALNAADGVSAFLVAEKMTRAPLIQFPTVQQALHARNFIESESGNRIMLEAFASTTNHGSFQNAAVQLVGRKIYLRVEASSGEAMGMNMVTAGVDEILRRLGECPEMAGMEIVTVSSNFCTDKKSASVNWIQGRGRAVIAEGIIPPAVVQDILHCSVSDLVNLGRDKLLVGSGVAGASAAAFNAHAANIVAAIFLATGQDMAQVVESSACLTLLEERESDGALHATVTMPCIEVGTVGGGTHLRAQASARAIQLQKDRSMSSAGWLACVIGAAVLGAELSLLSSLVCNDLMQAHVSLNRTQ